MLRQRKQRLPKMLFFIHFFFFALAHWGTLISQLQLLHNSLWLEAVCNCLTNNWFESAVKYYCAQKIAKQRLTIWHTKGKLIWLMPPAKTPNVSPVWKRKLRSVCQPFLLMRITLQNMNRLSIYSFSWVLNRNHHPTSERYQILFMLFT